MPLKAQASKKSDSPHRIGNLLNHLSHDKRLNKLLNSVLDNVKRYAEDQITHIRRLTQIGLALSAEKDINKLFELIVDEARALSNADAGSLYILSEDKTRLRFVIIQTDSLDIRMGGTSGEDISLEDVRLYIDNQPNYSHVASHVALSGETVNIPDVYEAEGFDFTGPRQYDENTGYRSKSMLVIPMKNHEKDIIGVLQLINAQDPETDEVISFSTEYEDLIASLASQAAVALTNTQLIEDLTNLLYSFIKSVATAIDEKSPYTGGHINRVVDLTISIAESICKDAEGPFKNVCFSKDEIEELKMAAWMHDVGKITTPEYVINKHTKLETVFDRIELIHIRFYLIKKSAETDYLKQKIELLQSNENEKELERLENKFQNDLKILEEEKKFLCACNNPGELMTDEKRKRIRDIGAKIFVIDGKSRTYLTEDEINNLSIIKGSLTDDERRKVENHVTMTEEILGQLSLPRKLSNVPVFAGGHHEKLDGSGYPHGLAKAQLPLQSRIIAIADIFEALTAKDRPYKEPMSLSQALNIMDSMKKNGQIDTDIYDLFINCQLYLDYAKNEMNPDQIDIPD